MIQPRTARVTIFQGDDLARLAELDAAVARAEAADETARQSLGRTVIETERRLRELERPGQDSRGVRLMHEDDPLVDARRAHAFAVAERDQFEGSAPAAKAERDAYAAQAEERGTQVALKAVHRRRWRKLMAEHRPREGNDDDALLGVNMETLPDVLLQPWMPREALGSLEHAGSIDLEASVGLDSVDDLDGLSDYDYYDRVFMTAFALNRGSAAADPTRRLLSASSQTSDATSS